MGKNYLGQAALVSADTYKYQFPYRLALDPANDHSKSEIDAGSIKFSKATTRIINALHEIPDIIAFELDQEELTIRLQPHSRHFDEVNKKIRKIFAQKDVRKWGE